MLSHSHIGIIIPSGGSGTRFGSTMLKQYLEVGGLPVILHSVRTALSLQGVETIVIAAQQSQHGVLSAMIHDGGLADPRIHFVQGGAERQESVYNALQHASIHATRIVAIHDAVRPFASAALWGSVLESAKRYGAAIPVLPVSDTIKGVLDDVVVNTVDRTSLRRAQTPQAFTTDIVRHAYSTARANGVVATDCASLCEQMGIRVHCVPGEDHNIKFTTTFDATLAEAILMRNQ